MNQIHIVAMAEAIARRVGDKGYCKDTTGLQITIREALSQYWARAVAIVWNTQDVHRLANGMGRCVTDDEAKQVLQQALERSNQDDIGPHIGEAMLENLLDHYGYGRELLEFEQRALDHHERDFIIASTQDRFRVFNETDGVYASPDEFASIDEAKAFIKAFRARYDSTGYYNTAAGEQINPDLIGFEIQLAEPDTEGGDNNGQIRRDAGRKNPQPAHQAGGH